MVVDYSKWDALELSDDSDIEVHPNIDKRSFIRAKQNQIHQKRHERRQEIKVLKYERKVNDGLLERIDTLLESLKGHADQVTGADPEDFMMQALMENAGDPDKDSPPPLPEGVHFKEKQPMYPEMMASLVDQVKKEVGSGAEEKDWYNLYLSGVNDHKVKVQDLQEQLLARLAKLEEEEGEKITADKLHDGFNTSIISKKKEEEKENPKGPANSKTKAVEILNPGINRQSLNRLASGGQTSGADADIDEPVVKSNDDDEEDIELSPVARRFGQIKIGDYKECLRFISENHEVLDVKNHDGLLMEAFNAGLEGNLFYCKQCVHQALLLQYCRTLGKDGVGMFFKRVTTPDHPGQKVFADDVTSTFNRIKTRTAEIKADRASNPDANAGEVEQIQLHAVEPGSTININVPQPGASEEIEIEARKVFESFPPGLQRALESGSLDRVNEVLGKMSVSEAEQVVDQLGEAGMLSMEKGVIDGTTAEGQRKLRELEEEAKMVQVVGEDDEELEQEAKMGQVFEEVEDDDDDGPTEKLKALNVQARRGELEEIEIADTD